jgi:hypothetical protein
VGGFVVTIETVTGQDQGVNFRCCHFIFSPLNIKSVTQKAVSKRP